DSADRVRICRLSRIRHDHGLVSARLDAAHCRGADVAGEHHAGRSLHSRQHQTHAQTSNAGQREDLGFRPSVREWRSRRHRVVRIGSGLGGIRSDHAQAPQRSGCAANSGGRDQKRRHRHRRWDNHLSGTRLCFPSSRHRRPGLRHASIGALIVSVQNTIRRLTAPDIRARKGGEPIVSLTSYHPPTARIVDTYCDVILVGDSLGMVMHGLETTIPVTLDMMILQGLAVMRGSKRALVVVDMPFGSYEASKEQAFASAARVLKETGCGAIKLEGGRRMAETIAFLVERGVPVMGHVGLTPQAINALGSFRAQGRDEADWAPIEADARAVADSGAFAVVLEAVAEPLARRITAQSAIPTIGIGASPVCDGQILVLEDMLGVYSRVPKLVTRCGELGPSIRAAVEAYAGEVKTRRFPGPDHIYPMKPKTK